MVVHVTRGNDLRCDRTREFDALRPTQKPEHSDGVRQKSAARANTTGRPPRSPLFKSMLVPSLTSTRDMARSDDDIAGRDRQMQGL